MFKPEDEGFMRRAMELALRGEGGVRGGLGVFPNPLVGAVVARPHGARPRRARGGMIIAEGWHKKFGGPHAETTVLSSAKKMRCSMRGATLYVNLEPCAHHGKTPPCVDAIIAAGISRVVCAMEDPNPLVSGRGFAALRRAGIKIDMASAKIANEAAALNTSFIKAIKFSLPKVTLKAAISIDGKIATSTGDSKWISRGPEATKLVMKLRAASDAILVGKNTVLADDPRLTVRADLCPGKDLPRDRVPIRIIVDSRFETPLSARVFNDSCAILATTSAASRKKINALEARGIAVWQFAGKRVPLRKLLQKLYREGYAKILVEGGGAIAASLVRERLIDDFYFSLAPMLLGGDGISVVGPLGVKKLIHAHRVFGLKINKIDDGFLVQGQF